MNKRRHIVFIAIAASLFSNHAFGQGSVAGGRPSAADVQYAFDAPQGWKKENNAQGYMFTGPGESVIILVKPHGENDFAKAVRTTEIDSTYRVIGEPRVLDNGGRSFRVSKVLSNGTTGVVDVFVLLSPKGGGVIVMALSAPANADAAYRAGLQVANSVDFTGGARAALPASVPRSDIGNSPWSARLSNRHLLYLFSGNGYFEERHYYLCSNGNFYFKAGSGGYTSGNVDGGSFAGRSGNSGRWAVSGSTLVLQYLNGNVVRLNLTERQKSNEIGLNGSRYFIEAQPNCQ